MEAKETDEMEQPLSTIDPMHSARASSLRRRVSAMVFGTNMLKSTSTHSNRSSNINPSGRSLILTSKDSNNSPVLSAINLSFQPAVLQLSDRNSNSAALPRRSTVLKTRTSNTLQEDTFQKFQEDILHREWLPIAKQLKPGKQIYSVSQSAKNINCTKDVVICTYIDILNVICI